MNHQAIVIWMLASVLGATACSTRDCAPGRPAADTQVIPPGRIMDFNRLYGENCAGCHGPDGKGGAATELGNPVYLAIADDATLRHVITNGVPGTAMPAFAQHAGGILTDDQINAIIGVIRVRWARPDVVRDVDSPPYAGQGPGDPTRGAVAYSVYCSSCHGADGRGGQRASSIVDGSYLALVSDQSLRTTVITGRPEMGAPDWRGDVPGKPMSPENVSDVVAWIAAKRPQVPAQSNSTAVRPEGGIR